MPDAISAKLLKNAVKDCELAKPAMAAWKLLQPEMRTMQVLISSLQTEGREWLDRNPGVSTRSGAAGKRPTGAVGKDECRHCGAKGHFEADCWLKHPEKASGPAGRGVIGLITPLIHYIQRSNGVIGVIFLICV